MKNDISINILPIDGKYILTIIGGDRTIEKTFKSKEELREKLVFICASISKMDKKTNELSEVSFNSLHL